MEVKVQNKVQEQQYITYDLVREYPASLHVHFFSGYSVVVQQFTCVFYPGPGGPLGTSRLLPCLSKGLRAFQGDTGGSQGVCAPPRYVRCSAGRTRHQQDGAPEVEQARGQAATHRRQEPRPFSRSRRRLCPGISQCGNMMRKDAWIAPRCGCVPAALIDLLAAAPAATPVTVSPKLGEVVFVPAAGPGVFIQDIYFGPGTGLQFMRPTWSPFWTCPQTGQVHHFRELPSLEMTIY
ncbi:hypothetical protein NDU88_004235 [Pleurodeles waltl]|uniref:Uncharacterized protein n=1 Tax=Pleurodeles waltl TaxID=8319 RepID=A0AAV7RHM4_PLEWA|nr:hypothetical protein NDU88_004235 [Pleurodeles waltl]